MTDNDWIAHFPGLEEIQDPQWFGLLESVKVVDLPMNKPVFQSGDQCNSFLLVIEGSVRVQKLSENGREIVLYRVEDGQSCVLTTACLLGNQLYQAEAITETPVRAVVMPEKTFNESLDNYRKFREFVFSSYSRRIVDLLMLIDAISFGRIDIRLAAHLQALFQNSETIHVTHQELARDLGSAREVISRVLKEFERKGMLNLGRGRITLLDPVLLARSAEM